jgi:O-antigen ligase
MAAQQITPLKLVEMLRNDSLFRFLVLLDCYVLLLHPLLGDAFSFLSSPGPQGVVRGSIILSSVAYIVGYSITLSEENSNLAFWGLFVAGTLQAVAMLRPEWFPDDLIYASAPVAPVWLSTGEIVALQRQAGFWDLSTQAADFMAIMICLEIALLLYSKSKKLKLIALIAAGFSLFALLASLQRGPFIAIAILFLLIVFGKLPVGKFKMQKKRAILKFAVALVFVLSIVGNPYLFLTRQNPFSSESSRSRDYRTEVVWPSYLEFVSSEPTVFLFGAGFGCDALDEYGRPKELAHAHNQYLGWLAGIGFFMTILFICSLFIVFKRARVCISSHCLENHEKMVASFYLMFLMVISLIAFIESPLNQEPISILFFFFGGTVSSLYRMHTIRKQNCSVN